MEPGCSSHPAELPAAWLQCRLICLRSQLSAPPRAVARDEGASESTGQRGNCQDWACAVKPWPCSEQHACVSSCLSSFGLVVLERQSLVQCVGPTVSRAEGCNIDIRRATWLRNPGPMVPLCVLEFSA